MNKDNYLVSVLNSLLEKHTIKFLSDKLNLAPGTLKRWIENKDIPKNYEFDLFKLAGIPIDYSKYSTKLKDQFYTPIETAKICFDLFSQQIKKYGENEKDFVYIEPSAGDGNFLKVFPDMCDRIAMDIEPKHPDVFVKDYLDWKPEKQGRYVVFGNPPFGLRGHTALKFINHSSSFAEYVCFILPQLFEIDGKGVPRKRVQGFHLLFSKKLETHFYEPNKKELKINIIFQIWSKNHVNEDFIIPSYMNTNDTNNTNNINQPSIKIFSLSDGGTPASTRNKNMLDKCDLYIPSTCFGKENMKCYTKFDSLPGKKGYGIVFYNADKEDYIKKMSGIQWNQIAFLSTNSAYNLRSSQILYAFHN